MLWLLSTSTSAQSIPSTPGWFQIPNTTLRNVCPPNFWGGSSYAFADNCRYVVEAWNSAVFDTRRNRLIIWGGGHADYLGNEVYAVDLNTLSVSRLTNPALPVVTSGCQESIGSQPNSRHTYDGIAYMENVDRMFVFGGSLSYCGYLGNGTWTFDFATSTWQQMNPTGTIPQAQPGIVSAYDRNTGKVFLHDNTYLYSYDFSMNRYQQLSGSNPIDYHMTAAIDPVRKKFVIVGAGNVYAYDISSSSSYTRQSLSTTGGSAIVSSNYPGLAYDPVIDQIVAWNGGDTVYSLNLDSGVWTATTYAGGPGAAPAAGTYGRWSYAPALDAFVVVNSMLNNAYTLRLGSSGSSVPTAPTSLNIQ
jgi:hypothetical protein